MEQRARSAAQRSGQPPGRVTLASMPSMASGIPSYRYVISTCIWLHMSPNPPYVFKTPFSCKDKVLLIGSTGTALCCGRSVHVAATYVWVLRKFRLARSTEHACGASRRPLVSPSATYFARNSTSRLNISNMVISI
eukprot:6191436-Pleurochrysis_carterae.AAC.3